MTPTVKAINLILLATLSCIEKLCSIMNLVSIERDWVVIISRNNKSDLQVLNSQMRRIDLFCKLLGPLVIGFLDGFSTKIAVLTTFGWNVASVVTEYYAIAKVYKIVPALQRSPAVDDEDSELTPTNLDSAHQSSRRVIDWVRSFFGGVLFYYHSPAFLPSLSASLLYFTVLSFAGQMITYLLSVGYTPTHITIARTVSVLSEISATWIAPKVMSRIGPIRSGIWFISWQMIFLAVAVGIFWNSEQPLVAASGLVGGVILSRVGLRGFDLSTQIIVQEEINSDHRGSFSSLEASLQNAFEICSYISTIVFSKSDQFQWPVLMSAVAVFTAGGLYTAFVKERRGHVLHMSPIYLKERIKRSFELSYERFSQ
ncbi:MAG: hypothetical protein M1840_004522 [Geoglossum simile]|nr:MAG: hypothetical protein M1840_004522 [Geoglossum simile]